ncbi:zf-HC2 domain-containing protein [Paenibacillus filicis]|uniref:Zf-HC2 domain-containing protein n=1 Tax=Paenibacillus gyeongsangnamensis TaxID=3388067 RepID=A0ABT4Q7W1_9BACL|nr:zf-HC2 domain-containing protein [Paenibacillus filicis]MCZ8512958.1 zf-HC2 domain-containing protein [Paenibacillus filicis]
MKCNDIHECFGIYWDLPEDDPKRQAVDDHIRHCEQCAEEFEIWRESTLLIRSTAEEAEPVYSVSPVSSNVMKRIYEDESWRMPIGARMYHFSYKLRRNLTAIIAFCLALFMFTFLFLVMDHQKGVETASGPESSVFGRLGDPVVVASSQEDSMNVHSMPTAVASLKGFSKPFTYQVGPIHTMQDYLLFVSLLGLTCTLLIMNWLSRTRS